MDERNLHRRAAWCLLGLGVAARFIQYLSCAPLWHDELALVDGLLQAETWPAAMSSLPNAQVAPPWFCAMQWLVIHTLGCSEYTVRLMPLLAGLAALGAFSTLCWRRLESLPALVAIGIFSVSSNLIEYAAESKPYSSDVTATVLILFILERWQATRKSRNLVGLIVVTPLLVGASFPALFVLGGALIWLASQWVRMEIGDRLALAGCSFMLVGSFAVLLTFSVSPTSVETMSFMNRFWEPAFFPWQTPVRWPNWLWQIHTGELMAYPLGGGNGASLLTTIAFGIGLAVLISKQQFAISLGCLAPFLLCLIASGMQRYPYGYLNRTAVFLSPIVIIVAAIGTSSLLAWLRERLNSQRPMQIYVMALVLLCLVPMVSTVVKPSRTRRDWQSRSFARWFWNDSRGKVTLCAVSDLGVPLRYTYDYRCHQRMYSPHLHGNQNEMMDRLRIGDRVRIVFPADPRIPHDIWLTWETIRLRLPFEARLVSEQRFIVNPNDPLLCPIYHVRDLVVVKVPTRERSAQIADTSPKRLR